MQGSDPDKSCSKPGVTQLTSSAERGAGGEPASSLHTATTLLLQGLQALIISSAWPIKYFNVLYKL